MKRFFIAVIAISAFISSCSLEENPQVIEGKRPAITLEHLDQSSDSHMQIFNQPRFNSQFTYVSP